jgi:hypothetical protein
MEEKYLRLHLINYRATKNKLTVRAAIVSEIVDSYETVIPPRGLISPLESVPVDYNHNFISTGAKIKDAGFTDISIPDGNGGEKEVEARVVDIEVYEDSKMWTKENQNNKPEDVPSLLENIQNGRIGWVSVFFTPVEKDIEIVRDVFKNIIRKVYTKWRLNYLSFLDKKPGQDTGYFLDVRSFNKDKNNNLNFTRKQMEELEKVQEELKRAQEELAQFRSYVGDIVKQKSDGKMYMVTQTVMTADSTTLKLKDQEGNVKEISGDQVSYDPEADIPYVYGSMSDLLSVAFNVSGTKATGDMGTAQRDADGDDSDDDKEDEEQGDDKEGSDKEEDNDESGSGKADSKKRDAEDKEKDDKEKEGDEEDEDEEGEDAPTEEDNLRAQLEEKDQKLEELQEKFTRLSNSPKEDKEGDEDSATDGDDAEGGEDAEEDEVETEEAASRKAGIAQAKLRSNRD